MKRGECARMTNGYCPFTGGRCMDGRIKCPMWRSLKQRTAALVRWARARRGEGKIGRGK